MYRSKDVEFMNDLKLRINELNYNAYSENEFAMSWEQTRRYIVLDDLNVFLKEKYALNQIPYLPEYVFNYDTLNPNIMFVTQSENKIELDMLDTIIAKAGISNYYRTSYMKHSDVSMFVPENKSLGQVLLSEIKLIQPKIVVFFGFNASCCIRTNIIHQEVRMENMPPIMVTSSLLDLFSKDLNMAQINTLKHYIWCDIVQYTTK